MNRFTGFTGRGNQAICDAIEKAGALGHTYVGSEHLLLGLMSQDDHTARIMVSRGVQAENIMRKLLQTVGRGVPTQLTVNNLTPRCCKIIETAANRAKQGSKPAGTEHLMMALLKETDCYACRFLTELSISTELLMRDLSSYLSEAQEQSPKGKRSGGKSRSDYPRCPNLEKYSRDLTLQAAEGKLDPVIGREKEVRRVLEILSRRSKNNPCLIGEAGVGKTAVIEGVAQLIAEEAVPDRMKDLRIFSVDLAGMIAGTKFRGEFEERVRACLQEVRDHGNIILFVDEIHTIMGAGAAEGAIDAANILKPQLARGEIQMIGATTREEYRRYIEKDAALARRFAQVVVDEPSQEMTLEILRGLRSRYEKHHGVQISNKAIEAAVRLSIRYLPERFLPDKAIDLMDEAAAYLKLEQTVQNAFVNEDVLSLSVREEQIAQVLSRMVRIPVKQLLQDQNQKLLALESVLQESIVGQKNPVSAVAAAIRRSSCGINDPQRPLGSFLFLGPTGVGKTQLCRALARALFDREDAIIRIDMSEYMEKHSVSRLIGTPPGYIGYDEGGQLTEKVRRAPFSIVLFDEVEKAHPDVFHLFLQLLDEGYLNDSSGRKVDFRNCVIVMTSNIGAKKMAKKQAFGFQTEDAEKSLQNEVYSELKMYFQPEFLGRIDEILFFHHLTEIELTEVAHRMIDQLKTRFADMDITLQTSPHLPEKLISCSGMNPAEGARSLKRLIRKQLEDPLAAAYLSGLYGKGDRVYCEMADELVIHKLSSESLQNTPAVV